MDGKEKIKVSVLIPCYNVGSLITRCLESIPVRKDVEIVLLDDYSTDDTMKYVQTYAVMRNPEIRVYQHFTENEGISKTVDELYELAAGEYLYILDSDDYLLPDWERVLDELDGTDMVYIDAKTPTTYLDKHDEENHNRCAAWFYFLRKDFLGNEKRTVNAYGGDYEQYLKLTARPHTAKFTGICAYFYNYPRKGSVIWKIEHNEI